MGRHPSTDDQTRGWWASLSGATKAFILALAGGLLLAVVTGPLGPALSDVGSRLNPFERGRHSPRIAITWYDQNPTDGWIIPKPVDQISSLPRLTPAGTFDRAAWDDWLSREHAVAARTTTLGLALQGGSAKSVLITRLEVEIVARRPPLPGTWVRQERAGGTTSRYFRVDLDNPGGPTVQPFAPPTGAALDAVNQEELVDFPYHISETELEHFVIYASTRTCDCDWIGRLHWVVDGKSGQTIIDDNGRPFRVTGTTAAHTTAVFRTADPEPKLTQR